MASFISNQPGRDFLLPRMGCVLDKFLNFIVFFATIRGVSYVMFLIKRRLIVFSVVLGVLLLLVDVTASVFEDPPTRGSREFEQAMHELTEKVVRASAEAHYRLSKFFKDGLVVDQKGWTLAESGIGGCLCF
jgi:hypothetical protein